MLVSTQRAIQIQLDFETDQLRRERNDWNRAIECNLHALQDYVMPHQVLVWQPGARKRGRDDSGYRLFNVQIATTDTCTCQRFKLHQRCEHIAFVKRIESEGIELGQDVPVRAVDIIEGNEVAA